MRVADGSLDEGAVQVVDHLLVDCASRFALDSQAILEDLALLGSEVGRVEFDKTRSSRVAVDAHAHRSFRALTGYISNSISGASRFTILSAFMTPTLLLEPLLNGNAASPQKV